MYKYRKSSFGKSISDDVKMENKSLCVALTEAYLDNWCNAAFFWTNKNLCGHRNNVTICDLDCLNGIVRIKVCANEKEIKDIYRFALNMAYMNCKVSVVYEEQFQSYIKEVTRN